MLSYKKIAGKTWDNAKDLPRCPSKGAFEVLYEGDTYWILDGQLHREDGPAVEWAHGARNIGSIASDKIPTKLPMG